MPAEHPKEHIANKLSENVDKARDNRRTTFIPHVLLELIVYLFHHISIGQ
jgi:hypothetical protein